MRGEPGSAGRAWRVPLVLLGLGLLLNLVPWPPSVAEPLYLGLFHPAWSAFTSRLVDLTGVSLSGLLVVALVAVPLLLLAWGGSSAGRRALRIWGHAALTLLLLFPFTFGLGYRMAPLEQRAGVGSVELTASLRAEIAQQVLELMRSAVASGRVDSRQLAAPETVAAASRCVAAEAAALRGSAAPALPERIKHLPAGLLLRFGFAGVVSPWLLEPHVDAGLPPAAELAVALHEFAHAAGFAPEAEAEAVGLLAGLGCDDERVAYAAALRLAGGLAAALPPEQRAAFVDAWPERAVNDQRAAALATARFRSRALAPGFEAAYDLYLRSQGEALGLLEYDRGTDLALRLLVARGG